MPNESSKNDKKGKVNQVKANVTPQTSSEMAQSSTATQNNSSETKKGESNQYSLPSELNTSPIVHWNIALETPSIKLI